MLRKILMIIVATLAAAVAAVYLWPVPRSSFDAVYSRVDAVLTRSLRSFRTAHPVRQIRVGTTDWEYVSFGAGKETILFLHGMTGAHDIWWNQMEAMSSEYRVISVTYPAVKSLSELGSGILAILDAEGVDRTNIAGSSLGGYLAQYLVAQHPERVMRVVFSNTFPPNDLIAKNNRTIGLLLPYLPEWLVISVLRGSFASSVYPASGNDELTLAFLNEIGHGRMSKSQVISRFRTIVERFEPADTTALGIPVMIVEADNDPLVEPELRRQLRQTYPAAELRTLSGVGHFPYLNRAGEYTTLLRDFFTTTEELNSLKPQP